MPQFKPTPADGAAALNGALKVATKFCVLPSTEVGYAVVLWAACTHVLPELPAAPRLAITSAVKRSGKTRLLDIVEGMVHQPLVTVNATPAAVFRSLGGEHPPTLVVDEADTIFGSKKVAENNEDLRALLNAGFQRGKPALRCVGPQQKPTFFPTFAMAALAGIGKLPDTISDRAINVRMKRRKHTETVAPFRERRDRPQLKTAQEALATWLADVDVRERLKVAEPTNIGLEDRSADVWEPLIAVADEAGGEWPLWARAAAKKLTDEAGDEIDDSDALRVLDDLRGVFKLIQSDWVATEALVQRLVSLDDAPWREAGLTGHRLGKLLGEVGIKSVRDTTGNKRGYKRSHFADAWERYPAPTEQPGGDQ
jgi:hypothetical protein